MENDDKVIYCTYVNGEGETNGLAVMDMPCACYTAAALSMMPADIADENIKSGNIEESLRENLYEVFNVAVSFFSNGTTPDMRLKDMVIGSSIPDDASQVVDKSYTNLHVALDIPGYGKGNSSLYLS